MGRAPQAIEPNDVDATSSVLGRGARVRGRVSGDGDLRVEGAVEGDVTLSGELLIEEGAEVTGNVDAHVVTVNGALSGDVVARGPITIRAGAKVKGSLGGTEISLEEGADFDGRIEAQFDMPKELGGSGKR